MHASTCSSERNWSAWGLVYTKARNQLAIEQAEKIVYIRGNAGLQGNQGAAADEVELILQQFHLNFTDCCAFEAASSQRSLACPFLASVQVFAGQAASDTAAAEMEVGVRPVERGSGEDTHRLCDCGAVEDDLTCFRGLLC
ncbi:hypothetical protein VOLCADRAFT_85978 [Volvox carteri f. nagariensis]|uniref:HAT C-terminal dimerisation domain-containing protein n=1 Tax=Volvox carteri f. nagariensis TaxID=3068 RepID=D8THH7_VOLCA|nr:uncharacterized protein VOLCADRAFT_85978 [Volvox carteri f. nagariensis]EFJ52712.1 hypothetical protein VOLCADRAFT_85978 [Volvox carteri f. nagariensis]|eukprot:XP_002945717.1 hypothetical protein VOLCADRAFT_85978 [Volvox carteri f. nagariensis]